MASANHGEAADFGLKPRQTYDELTQTQQAIVDAITQGNDPSDAEVSEVADCSEQYVYMVRRSYPHIIEEYDLDLPPKGDNDGELTLGEFLDDETCERLLTVAEDITPDWQDELATPEETIRYLARFYFGED